MKKFMSVFMSLAITMTIGSMVHAAGGVTIKPVSALDGILGTILGIVQVIAVAFATGMLLYVGIKYTMASANEKADLKKGSISYVIGAVIIFACSAIIGVVQNLATEVETNTAG